MIEVVNPSNDFDITTDWLVFWRQRQDDGIRIDGIARIEKVLMEKVLWFNRRDGDPVKGGRWTDYVAIGFRCCQCKVLMFGSTIADFQHECGVKSLNLD